MWKFEDEDGRGWEIVVGRESWGGFFALFIPGMGHEEEDIGVRQTPVDADGHSEASRLIDEVGRSGWLRMLSESRPKEMG